MSDLPAKHTYLLESDLFRGLPPADVAAMGERAPMKRVESGALFFTAGQQTEVLFILKEGRVRLYRLSAEGRAFTTAILEPGSVFGEMALMGQHLNDSYAEALDSCLVCLMSRADVQTLLLGDPRIAVRIAEILGSRLIEAQSQLADFVFKRAPERLAALLLKLARKSHPLLSAKEILEVRHTHEELADMMGVQRETVTKTLKEWADQGIIELRRGRIRILNTMSLQLFTGE